MSNDLVKNGYNKAADSYLKSKRLFRKEKSRNEEYLVKLTGLLKNGSTILDIGCGSGIPVDKYLVEKGFNVIGVDISERQIELAREKVPEGRYEVVDMSLLKQGEYKVDAVVSFYAIFHIPRKVHGKLLKTINSFLPVGGLMLITMGSSDYEGVEENFHGVRMFWSHYNSDMNRHLVQAAGFEVIIDNVDTHGWERHQVILAKKTKE